MNFISIIESILPYISGLYTLPWIVVGLVVSYLLAKPFGQEYVDGVMKKFGLVLLFGFIPLLMFRIFLNISFGREELIFTGITFGVLAFMYLLAYSLAKMEAKKLSLDGMKRRTFLKTILTNQGRSAAFVGGALLAIKEWAVPAGIYIALVGVGLFAVIPYILSVMHKHERKSDIKEEDSLLPWYLRLYPWYLISFIIGAILIHHFAGVDTGSLGDGGTVLYFITALTIPAALYYVGSGIHPKDLKLDEMKKMILPKKEGEKRDFDWAVGRNAFLITMVYTPIIIALVLTPLMFFEVIPNSWFAVIVINSILPITSTNMFLVPYGLNRKGTALSVTWTTVVSVPLVLILIPVLSTVL
ncbi:MAG: hypothetical protein KGY76_02675 [Candidatus Thermoplasmatota archaeon]|nr:hypothetical protein [Candidatus Thermoplasmatota archaeon]